MSTSHPPVVPPVGAQRVVTIALTAIRGEIRAYYSYLSPVTGLSYQNAPRCDLQVDQPTYCLFVLDDVSTAAGWTITRIDPEPGSPLMTSYPGALNLSLLTFDPYQKTIPHYQFAIWYKNTITGELFHEDPQEGNGPPLLPPNKD